MTPGAVGAVASIAAGRHGVSTRKKAVSSGLSPHNITAAVKRGWLLEPTPGVLVFAGAPATWRQKLAVLLAAGKGRAAVSMRASTVLHRLEVFDDPDWLGKPDVPVAANVRRLGPVEAPVAPEVTILQPHWLAAPAEYGAVLHQAARSRRARHRHDRPASVHRTCPDAGRSGGGLLRRRGLASAHHGPTPARSQPDLALGDRHPTRPTRTDGGADDPATVARWADEGVLPESVFEDVMNSLLADPALPPMVRQHTIRDAGGSFVARVDAAVPAARVAIEAHSRRYHFGPIREAADEDRDLRITAAGFEVIYLGWYAT